MPCRISVFSRRNRERSQRENPPNDDFGGFPLSTFRPATRKYATIHALRFRLLFVVSLPGGTKSRHAKTRQNHHLASFLVATFRVFTPKTRVYDMTQISHHSFKYSAVDWLSQLFYVFLFILIKYSTCSSNNPVYFLSTLVQWLVFSLIIHNCKWTSLCT